MNDDEIILSLGIQLDNIKKDMKSVKTIFDSFQKANKYWDIGLDEKTILKHTKNVFRQIEKDDKAIRKIKQNSAIYEFKQNLNTIQKTRKVQEKAEDYKRKLKSNSAKLEFKIKQEEIAREKKLELEKYEYEKKLANAKFARRMANIRRAERREIEANKKIERDAKETASKISKTWRGAAPKWMGGDGSGTSFGHKFFTTAQYGAAGAALYKTQEALRAVIEESKAYDDALYNNMSVLQVNRKEAEALADTTRSLSSSYGGSIKEIDDLALTLGRAGVEYSKLADATKSAVELAKITGDSFSDASKVMSTFIISFQDRFKSTGMTVDTLRDKLVYMANATKMSTEDLGTFSNYALQTAKTLNLSVDTIGVLASSFSNLGMNASTIGTQIRKLDVVFKGNSKNISNFWDIINRSQDEYRKKLTDGKDEEAIKGLAEAIGNLSDEQFTAATRSMNIQERNLVSALRNADALGLISKHYTKISHALDATTQAQIKSLGATTMMERAWNSVKTSADGALTSLLDITGRDDIDKLNSKYNGLVERLSSLDKGSKKYKETQKQITSTGIKLKKALSDIDEGFKNIGKNISFVVKLTASIGSAVLIMRAYSKASVLMSASNATSASSFNILNASIIATRIRTIALTVAMRAVPFIAIAGGIYALTSKLFESSEAVDALSIGLENTSKKLSKLTKNQLEYRKVTLDKQLHEAYIKMQDAKVKAAESEGDANHKKYLKLKDDARQAFSEIRKSYLNVTQALKDFGKEKEKINNDDSKNSRKLNLDTAKDLKYKRDILKLDYEINKAKKRNITYNKESSSLNKDELEYYNSTVKLSKERIANMKNSLVNESKLMTLKPEKQKEQRNLQKEIRQAEIELLNFKYSMLKKTSKTESSIARQQLASLKSKRDSALLSAKQNDAEKTSLSNHKERLSILNQYKDDVIKITDEKIRSIELSKAQVAIDKENTQNNIKNVEIQRKIKDMMSKFYIDSKDKYEEQKRLFEDSKIYLEFKERGLDKIYEKLSGLDDYSIKLKVEADELESLNSISDTFNGITDSIVSSADAMNDLVKSAKALGSINTASLSLLIKQNKLEQENKELVAIRENIIKTSLPTKENGIKLSKLNNKLTENDYKNYSNIAGALTGVTGAMAGLAKEGSDEQKALLITQQLMATTAGVTAILAEGSKTSFAGMAVMTTIVSGLLASAGIAFSGGGGGSGTPKSIKDVQTRQETYKSETGLITDRLDRQITLLEALNKSGTALATKLTLGKTQYKRDAGDLSYKVAQDEVDYNQVGNERKNELAKLINIGSKGISTNIGAQYYMGAFSGGRDVKLNTTGLAGNINDAIQYIANLYENIDKIDFTLIDRFDAKDVTDWTNDAEQYISDYASSMLDVVATMRDAKDKFKNIYDELSGDNHYAIEDLQKAKTKVNSLRGSMPLTDYVKNQVETLQGIEDSFGTDIQTLLLSQDPADIQKQADALKQLSESMGIDFTNNTQKALDFIDSFQLVGDSLSESRKNIKEWNDSFKSQKQLASDAISKTFYSTQKTVWKDFSEVYGIKNSALSIPDFKVPVDEMIKHFQKLGKTIEDVNKIKENLSKDGYYSDSEKEAVNMNKALVESSNALKKAWKNRNETEQEHVNRLITEAGLTTKLTDAKSVSEEAYRAEIDAVYDRANADGFIVQSEYDAINSMEEFADATWGVSDAVTKTFSAFDNFKDSIGAIYGETLNLDKAISSTGHSVPTTRKALESLYDTFDKSGDGIDEYEQKILDAGKARLKESQEALKTSKNNINSWKDSFKNQQELASDTMAKLTYNTYKNVRHIHKTFFGTYATYSLDSISHNRKLATSFSELDKLYIALSTDSDGLTDSEKKALDLNKSILDYRKKEKDSLQDTYDLLLGNVTQRQLDLEKIDETNKALQKSIWAEQDRQESLVKEEDRLNSLLSTVTENINSMESAVESITDTVNKLRGVDTGTGGLDAFNKSMSKLQAFKVKDNYSEYKKLLDKTIGLSSVLFDETAFSTKRDMEFAKLVNAKKFEDLGDMTETEVGYLKNIEINTKNQIKAIKEAISTPNINQTVDNYYNNDSGLGYANGGYTGDTGGIVHPKEYVLNAETSSKLGLNDSTSTGVFGELVSELKKQNGILSKQNTILKQSRDIQNESLVKLEELEEVS